MTDNQVGQAFGPGIRNASIAVDNNLTVEQIANAFTVYPSLSGSIAEVARQLHTRKTAGEV
ncbi:hypothetical protein AB0E88_33320 [Streptomyces sp. NPDC028635]|uniref:hypothetical protein n=1 Tax=Streptomyces sp. NPDC028635 TaxID=3154800 RepID=UPI0033CC39B1